MSRDGDPNPTEADASLYERDFFSWTLQQADLLRSGHLQVLDVATSSRRSKPRAVRSALR